MSKKKSGPSLGRPPKFAEPSSTLTLTLPDRILRDLENLDSDRAKAIVKCVEAVTADQVQSAKGYEVFPVSSEQGLMILGPNSALQAIPWLQLIEIAPGRFLISVPSGTPIAELEVALLDLADSLPADQAQEKSILLEFRQQLAESRRQEQASAREILLVGLTKKLALLLPATLPSALLTEGERLTSLLPLLPW